MRLTRSCTVGRGALALHATLLDHLTERAPLLGCQADTLAVSPVSPAFWPARRGGACTDCKQLQRHCKQGRHAGALLLVNLAAWRKHHMLDFHRRCSAPTAESQPEVVL